MIAVGDRVRVADLDVTGYVESFLSDDDHAWVVLDEPFEHGADRVCRRRAQLELWTDPTPNGAVT